MFWRCVNLPRWGLKRFHRLGMRVFPKCKFTPLGFETLRRQCGGQTRRRCKFTPLGFETMILGSRSRASSSVNLPRWGLKRLL